MSIVAPSERGEWWCPNEPCLFCSELIAEDQPAVLWAGQHTLMLHPACAEKLGAHLIADAREATLASGQRHWTSRTAKALRAATRSQEWQT